MPHQGKASAAATAMLLKAAIVTAGLAAGAWFALPGGRVIASILVSLGLMFALFTLWFFRDPEPATPQDPGLMVAPGHGLVDLVDETDATAPMTSRVKRISIFLSVFDVHVQQAPLAGEVVEVRHQAGRFLNAIKADCADHNEHVRLVIRPAERPDALVGVRLIAGLIARRILPWVAPGEVLARGQRISLIQFGSRVELLLPLDVEVLVRSGQRVKGGETALARWKP